MCQTFTLILKYFLFFLFLAKSNWTPFLQIYINHINVDPYSLQEKTFSRLNYPKLIAVKTDHRSAIHESIAKRIFIHDNNGDTWGEMIEF